MTSEAVPLDRRHRRRQETIEEVLDHAVQIMAEEGVAGLSLGEIARRMGIRPPSLYVYFPSKHALYDALFKRGWELLLAAMHRVDEDEPPGEDLAANLLRFGREFARWNVENSAYCQLLGWRPVPGFVPTEDAYQPAVELYEWGHRRFEALKERGIIRADADVQELQRNWTVIISGVVSQQLANGPDEPFDEGRFTAGALPQLTEIFAAAYAPQNTNSRARAKKTTTTTNHGRGHARQR